MAEIGKKTLRSWRRIEKTQALISTALERDLKGQNLPPLIWLRALEEIDRQPGGVRPFHLQQALLLEQPAVSRLLEKMAAKGAIARTECAEDRRGWSVGLTDSGRVTLERMSEAYTQALARHYLAHLGDKQARQLDEILGDLLDSARSAPSVSSAPASPSGT